MSLLVPWKHLECWSRAAFRRNCAYSHCLQYPHVLTRHLQYAPNSIPTPERNSIRLVSLHGLCERVMRAFLSRCLSTTQTWLQAVCTCSMPRGTFHCGKWAKMYLHAFRFTLWALCLCSRCSASEAGSVVCAPVLATSFGMRRQFLPPG
jgi:hypothetical protein